MAGKKGRGGQPGRSGDKPGHAPYAGAGRPPRSITLLIGKDAMQTLRVLALSRQVSPEALAVRWLGERIEEEWRKYDREVVKGGEMEPDQDALIETEEGFRILVEWYACDQACAPTGAPSLEWLRQEGARRGYDISALEPYTIFEAAADAMREMGDETDGKPIII